MADQEDTQTWPDLAIGRYDPLTGRDAEILYNFDNFELHIPSSTAANAEQATWKANGALRISTRYGSQAKASEATKWIINDSPLGLWRH
ncbi:hypothetical protein OAS39_10995 [Pirellulales bacterium]|nr:hypothetical protein [Pirellulales bacterium]